MRIFHFFTPIIFQTNPPLLSQLILSNIKERDEGLGETAETNMTLHQSLFSRNPELPPTSVKFNASRKEKCSGSQKDAFFLKNIEKTRGGGRQRRRERDMPQALD